MNEENVRTRQVLGSTNLRRELEEVLNKAQNEREGLEWWVLRTVSLGYVAKRRRGEKWGCFDIHTSELT